MQGIWRIGRVAVVSLLVGGCFPPVDKADVTEDDVAGGSGQDTTAAEDTTPQEDTAPVDTTKDTASIDAIEADTGEADTGDADTIEVDTTSGDTLEVDTTPPECVCPDDCQHLAGVCTKVVCLGGTCAAQPDTGASCDDGDPCTRDDSCGGFVCAGTAYACDDGEVCTEDVCDGDGGCDYPAKDGACWIAGQCYSVGDTKPGDSCRICQGGESWSPNDGAICDDGDDVCTLGDTCDGMMCVGGGPPDDTAGDWATSIVNSVAPQRSTLAALLPVGVTTHWLMVVNVTGGALVPTSSGDVAIEGDQVVAVRRASASTYIDLRTQGFGRAKLAASDDWNGSYALALHTTGAGDIVIGSDTYAVEAGAWNVLIKRNNLGVTRMVRTLSHGVDDIAMLSDGSTITAGTTNTGLTIDGTSYFGGVGDEDFDGFTVGYTSTGDVAWAGHVATPGYWTADTKVARDPSGGFVAAFPFRGTASAEFPGGTVELTSGSPNTTFGLLVVSGSGEVIDSFVPVTYDYEQQQGASLAQAPEVAVTSDGRIELIIQGAVGPQGSVSDASALSILGIQDGQVVWSRTVTNALPLVASVDRLLGVGMSGVTTFETAFSIVGADGTLFYASPSESTSAVFYAVDSDGELAWVTEQPLSPSAEGFAIPLAVRSRSADGRGLAIGGLLQGSQGTVPGEPNLVLTSGAEQSAWAGFVNSAGGLICGGTP